MADSGRYGTPDPPRGGPALADANRFGRRSSGPPKRRKLTPEQRAELRQIIRENQARSLAASAALHDAVVAMHERNKTDA